MFNLYGWLSATPAARALHTTIAEVSAADVALVRRLTLAPIAQVGSSGALSV